MIELNKQLEKWLDAGIITRDQADLMRHSVAGPPDGFSDATSRRIPIVAEIFGYVGAALAIWAVLFLVSEFWGNLTDLAQAALFAGLAVGLFAAGAVILDSEEPALRRLASVLLAGSVVAIAGSGYMVLDPILGMSAEGAWSLVGAVAAVVSGLMLWRHTMPAQQVVLFAAVTTTVMWTLNLVAEPETFVYGFVAWGVGLTWVLVARAGVIQPPVTAMTLGALSMLYGSQLIVIDGYSPALGIMLGLASAALFAAAGVALKERATIVLGGIGIFWFVPQAMFHFFGDAFGGMFGLFLSGLAIVALAIWLGRRRETP